MIISYSGHIGSGKDLCGKITQYLVSVHIAEKGYMKHLDLEVRDMKSLDNFINVSGWTIKKFAGKLKDCVCIILGCTREQLEDINFKNTELGEEWIRYGYADGFFQGGSQGTVMNNAPCDKERYEIELRTNWQTAYKFNHTPRSILQMLGTEVGRFIHSDLWINALFADYKCNFTNNPWYKNKDVYSVSEEDELQHEMMYPNWIITDLRFPNELKAIKDRQGITIRVNRDDERSRFAAIDKPEERSKYYHPSEIALDDATFDYVIDNNGSVDELIRKIKLILEIHNII